MKDYDKNQESLYLKYWDVNSLYDQKLPLGNRKWAEKTSTFNEVFIKCFNDESDEGYFLKGDIQYPENLHNPHNDLPFLVERMKIEKIEKLVTNLRSKEEYVIHIRN